MASGKNPKKIKVLAKTTPKVSKKSQTSAKSAPGKLSEARASAKPSGVKAKKPATAEKVKPATVTKNKSSSAAAAATKVASDKPLAKSSAAAADAPGKNTKMTSAPKQAAPVSKSAKTAKVAKPVKGAGGAGSLSEEQIRNAPAGDYMNDAQLVFFRDRLLQMRAEVLARELEVKERLHQREVFADPADRASAEEEHWLDLRLRERESLLLRKIEDALRRIRDKEYGWCEKTGEPIGIARLLARPTATVCVDIKGQDERAESQYRDR